MLPGYMRKVVKKMNRTPDSPDEAKNEGFRIRTATVQGNRMCYWKEETSLINSPGKKHEPRKPHLLMSNRNI
jgi:hypothetical protein